MVHSIFESFQNKSNPFRTPLFNVKCQETNSNATAPTTAVERKISAASVKGKLRIKCVFMRRILLENVLHISLENVLHTTNSERES